LFFFLITGALIGAADTGGASPATPRELVFLTWADYIDPELVREFEQQFNAGIRPVHFETDPVRDQMMLEADGRGYDVILVSETQLNPYRQRGWLAALDANAIPNRRHIDPRWWTVAGPASDYGVPYAWGALGIAYRADLAPEPITRWRQLFEPADPLRGKILMIKDYQDLFGVALKALGFSDNSTDFTELAAAERLLLAQKPYVKSYSYLSMGEDSELVTGAIAAAMIYNGDALMLSERHPAIRFVLPEEGTILWADYLAVAQSSVNKDLAMAFINFLNEPEHAARLARFVFYATPNRAAEPLLPAEFLNNPLIYFDPRLVERSEFHAELPGPVLSRRNRVVTELLR
jgi:spermidine/putrescine transport system substrate-binding protein